MDQPTTNDVDGACLCGAVRFAIELPTKWCAHCHCSMCRRAHGAAFVTWVGVAEAQFRITAGEGELASYRSSPPAQRQFCRVCGSPLLFRSARWPGEVHVAAASLLGPIDRAPAAHVFWSDRVAWLHVEDGLPRRGGATGVEPL